jgi:hypothetical protein
MNEYSVALTFTEMMLGTVPKDPNIYASYIASTAPKEQDTEDEIESVQESEERGWTGFHCDPNGDPIIYDYMLKGFFKDACSMLSRASGKKEKGKERIPKNHSSKIVAFKKIIDGLVFVSPRQIHVDMSGPLGLLERPLRAPGGPGRPEHVCLVRSDTVPVGSKIEFTLKVLGEVNKATIEEWLEYGALRGLGQWRNAGYGTFTYELVEAF